MGLHGVRRYWVANPHVSSEYCLSQLLWGRTLSQTADLAWIFAVGMSAGVVGSVSREASQAGCWSAPTVWWLGSPRASGSWGDQGGNCRDVGGLDWQVLLGCSLRFLLMQASHDSVGGRPHKSGGAGWQRSLGAPLEAGYHGPGGTCVTEQT